MWCGRRRGKSSWSIKLAQGMALPRSISTCLRHVKMIELLRSAATLIARQQCRAWSKDTEVCLETCESMARLAHPNTSFILSDGSFWLWLPSSPL